MKIFCVRHCAEYSLCRLHCLVELTHHISWNALYKEVSLQRRMFVCKALQFFKKTAFAYNATVRNRVLQFDALRSFQTRILLPLV